MVHAVLFVLLAWVRTGEPPRYEPPPVDVTLLPPLEGYSMAGAPGEDGGAPGADGGSGLRRLEPARTSGSEANAGLRGQSAAARATPTETAIRPPQREAPAAAAPPAPAELRPAQALAAAAPVEAEPPAVLAARVQPLESPLVAANRRAAPPALRPAQALTAEPDRPAEQLADAARPQSAPTVAAAARAAPSQGLRPAQTLAIDADRPAETLAQAARAQAPPSAVAAPTRVAPAGPLRPAQTLAIDADRPADTLAARAAGPQAPPTVAAAGGRSGAAAQLRTAGGLAGPLGPSPGGEAGGQGQAFAGGPGATGGGSGGSGAAGRVAGSHPGCEREILLLLTPEERAKCRETPGKAYGPNLPSNADRDRAERLAAMRSVPYLSNIAPEKRAFYDAVAAAKEARSQLGGGRNAGLSCNLGALFGGAGGAPTERIKIPGLPCSFIPPSGVLTEEARIVPP